MMRGQYLGMAFQPGYGRCRVFHDLDSTTHLILMPVGSDRTLFVPRSRVRFVKEAKR